MNAVSTTPVDRLPIAPAASESAAVLSVIERMATNPEIDISKLEKLMEMHERIVARNAKSAYAAALAEMQAEMPEIEERGKITVRKKDASGERTGDVQQATPYALWEDINAAIKPVMAKHGFALSFRTGQSVDGRVTVTGILMHREGHQEETTMILQHDTTGSKNAVQAIGSSTSYGKRYTAAALLNLTSRDGLESDDDGTAAAAPRPKTQSRDVDAQMRAEIDACSTVEELQRLWKSRPFQIEFERHPQDWRDAIIKHFNEAIELLRTDPPRTVDAKTTLDRQFAETVR